MIFAVSLGVQYSRPSGNLSTFLHSLPHSEIPLAWASHSSSQGLQVLHSTRPPQPFGAVPH
jgi:hypothetical protein